MEKGNTEPSSPDAILWQQHVRHWFPRLFERAYFVPPVYMNRVHYLQRQISRQSVSEPQSPVSDLPRGAPKALLESDARDDETQQRVLHCFQQLEEKSNEPMFVISQLLYADFLGDPKYTAAASNLPRPADLSKEKQRGDFDMLLFHKHYGFVAAEIKLVGDRFPDVSATEDEQDRLVTDKVLKALKQLNKAADVLRHLVSDKPTPPVVRKTLILPNVTETQLRRVVSNDLHVKQGLSRSLDVPASADPVGQCLCAEDFSDRKTPWNVKDEVLKRLSQWWIRRVAGPYISSTDDDYLELAARFCGPATTVRIFSASQPPLYFRSAGEGVAETSRRFTRDIVLHPYQVHVLKQYLALAYLCGPPGTGKTVMLLATALGWANQGWDVHVVSTWRGSLAASHLLKHQLEQNPLRPAGQRVHLHEFNFIKSDQMEAAVERLVDAATPGSPLCVVVDEVFHVSKGVFACFCHKLLDRVGGDLRLWAANLYHNSRPPCLTAVPMLEPLRTTPVITREVQTSHYIQVQNAVRGYADYTSPPPAQGPPVRYLHHSGEGHNISDWPGECLQCGKDLARELHELHVGLEATGDISIPAPLTYKEVFLLSSKADPLYDTETDDAGKEVRPASAIVKGLRENGVPVVVVRHDDREAVRKVSVREGPDAVVAAGANTVRGLERQVVIALQPEQTGTGTGDGRWERLHVMSRATAKLILVVWPGVEGQQPA